MAALRWLDAESLAAGSQTPLKRSEDFDVAPEGFIPGHPVARLPPRHRCARHAEFGSYVLLGNAGGDAKGATNLRWREITFGSYLGG